MNTSKSAVSASYLPLHGTGLQLSFSDTTTGHSVTISNSSEAPVTLKHVYPGIVHADGNAFDINSLLEKSALTVDAGSSKKLPIDTLAHNAGEKDIPTDLSPGKPIIVSTRIRNTTGELPVNTTRSYLA